MSQIVVLCKRFAFLIIQLPTGTLWAGYTHTLLNIFDFLTIIILFSRYGIVQPTASLHDIEKSVGNNLSLQLLNGLTLTEPLLIVKRIGH